MARCRRLILTVAITAAACAAVASPGAAASVGTVAWIDGARVLAPGAPPSWSGAIARYPDSPLQAIDPYWAGYAAMGLARAGDPSAAWRWASWYEAHMDADGIVPNVLLSAVGTSPVSFLETPVSPPSYDSADAYAALYVLALREAYRADPSRTRLGDHRSGLERALGLLRRLQDPSDGLVWNLPASAERPGDARPRVKLLMDQAEDYAALRAGAELVAALGRAKLRGQARAAAAALRTGLDGLWLPSAGAYAWAKHEGGLLVAPVWSRWYPDAVAQPFAVALGNWLRPADPLVGEPRAAALVERFAATWPEWPLPGFAPSGERSAGTGSGTLEYQPLLGAAFAAVGRAPEGVAGTAAIDAAAAASGRPWPFSVGHAGQALLVLGA